MLLPFNILFIAINLIPATIAILTDDAYHIDYHHELLGLPLHDTTFFYRPRKDDKASLLYTLSDLGIIGAINPGTGKLIWRQSLGDVDEERILRGIDGEGAIVSGLGKKVDCWDAMSGRARWNLLFAGEVRDIEFVEISTDGKAISHVLVLFEEDSKGIMRLLDIDSGNLIWEYQIADFEIIWRVYRNLDDIFLVSLHGAREAYNLRVTTIDPGNGKKRGEYILPSKADVRSRDDFLNIRLNSAAPILAWTDKSIRNININVLTRTGAISQKFPMGTEDATIKNISIYAPDAFKVQPHFLIYTESDNSNKAEVYHIDIKERKIYKAYELPKQDRRSSISISCEDSNVFFTSVSQHELITVSSASNKLLIKQPIRNEARGEIIHSVAEVTQRSADYFAVRFAALTASEAYILVRNSVEAWVRFEGLSGAVAAEWVEIPHINGLAATLHAEAHSSIIRAYQYRVRRHLHDLQYLPRYVLNLSKQALSSIFTIENIDMPVGLQKDKFGFNKLILVATMRGSIYALESNKQGSIAWSLKVFERSVANKWNVKRMWTDNAKGITTIYGADGELILLNPYLGKVIDRAESGSSLPIESTAVVESHEGRWILPIGLDGIPTDISSNKVPNGLLVTRSKNGDIQGVTYMGKNDLTPVKTWEFRPGFGQKIINVVSRPSHDPVASIGRVLGDRNVLYKYLNPNIILVTVVSDHASTASFYLLDAASGEILHSITHEAVDTKQSITSAITENWFVYSLWSDVLGKSRFPSPKGYQLVVSELFESKYPNDRGPLDTSGNFSSLNPSNEPHYEPAIPHVITQSFLIPEPISHMTVTQTRQGITSRQLICSLDHSNAIIGIPYSQLDPRRPVGRPPTPLEAEEGLTQYQPFMDFNPSFIITHEREVLGVKNVIASAALLESTSLIFAYGIDIFGTRLAPSMAFDILGNGFKKLSLLGTIVALTAGVAILAPIAKRRQINRIWTAH